MMEAMMSAWFKKIFIIFNLSFLILLLPTPALAATLSLSPTTGTFGRNCSFSVNINLDTQGTQTSGTDAILIYDPTQLSAQNIITGKIYSDYPGNTIDNTAGKVSIFALAATDKPFTGTGLVATVNFITTASASATTVPISLDFDPSDPTKTTDSNVIDKTSLKDVLSAVTNGSYLINQSSTGCKTIPQTQISARTLPDSGISELTWAFGSLGVVFILLSVFGFVFSEKRFVNFRSSGYSQKKVKK